MYNYLLFCIVIVEDANEQDLLTPVGSPIVLQRRGSVYGANVPMITGKYRINKYFKHLNHKKYYFYYFLLRGGS
jgi:hypothetical protein